MPAPAAKLLAGLGVEPFDDRFDRRAPARGAAAAGASPIKAALLGGDIVVGAGNIYACEALFEAGIDPRTRSDRLSRPRCEALAGAVRRRWRARVELGGSTLAQLPRRARRGRRVPAARRGLRPRRQACLRCGATIRRIVQGQRATFFCPRCQRR